jgi:PP-loop superfamily ATP-utilizing enzyme
MKVLVCGGRDWSDTKKTYDTLDKINKEYGIDVIIEGDARGADRMAGYWARKNRIDLKLYPADWDKYGKAAGYIRNQQMLDEGKPDLVVAFPGGKGTAMMVDIARKAGVHVIEVQ